jgi:hypothetical protein
MVAMPQLGEKIASLYGETNLRGRPLWILAGFHSPLKMHKFGPKNSILQLLFE